MQQFEIHNLTEYNIEESKLCQLVELALKKEKLINVNFNIILVDNQKIKEINQQYRNQNKVTDVITFALEDETWPQLNEIRILGDIYISIEQAKQQAKKYQHSFFRELAFLTIHGFYHLLGYNHESEEDEKIMFQKQEEVLEEYGLKR